MLALIDLWLQQAFLEHQNHVFGGWSIILVGNFEQLSPIIDESIYSQILKHDPLSNDNITAYRQFWEVYKLDVIQRQSRDSDDQHNFKAILLRLCDGESMVDDWKILAIRFVDAPAISLTEFSNTTCVLSHKSDVVEFNIDRLKLLNCPVARINAIHEGGFEAHKADSDVAKGLECQLLLARGARIMLKTNL